MKGKILAAMTVAVVLAGCHRPVSPDVLAEFQRHHFYTCCNLHWETEEINDANYLVGNLVPFGTPVTVVGMTNDSLTFDANGKRLTLYHAYGTEQESALAYFDKVLVAEDPKPHVASFSKAVQDAIRDGRVERGMTREQVLLSLGYPPTHRTPSLESNTWTYWYNRWITYEVHFDESGRVVNLVGRAPTNNQPVT